VKRAISSLTGQTPTRLAPSSSGRAYTPYGYRPSSDSSLTAFAGERCDAITEGYHLGQGHRLYLPRLKRLNCPDSLSPFGKGGINAYAYCAGDPVNRSDPAGRFPINANFLTSIELTRASTVAAYAAATMVALGTRIKSRSAVWGTRQLLAEAGLAITGVGILFSGSSRLEPLALGLLTLGNATSLAKSAITLVSAVRRGAREFVSAARHNIGAVFANRGLSPDVQLNSVTVLSLSTLSSSSVSPRTEHRTNQVNPANIIRGVSLPRSTSNPELSSHS